MDDKFTDLFSDYNPDMAPDSQFMQRLERNLRAVESAKSQLIGMRRKNRLAVIIAAVTGFICGILSTLCFPYLLELFAGSMSMIPADCGYVLAWVVVAAIVGIMTFAAYDITLVVTKKSLQPIRIEG